MAKKGRDRRARARWCQWCAVPTGGAFCPCVCPCDAVSNCSSRRPWGRGFEPKMCQPQNFLTIGFLLGTSVGPWGGGETYPGPAAPGEGGHKRRVRWGQQGVQGAARPLAAGGKAGGPGCGTPPGRRRHTNCHGPRFRPGVGRLPGEGNVVTVGAGWRRWAGGHWLLACVVLFGLVFTFIIVRPEPPENLRLWWAIPPHRSVEDGCSSQG